MLQNNTMENVVTPPSGAEHDQLTGLLYRSEFEMQLRRLSSGIRSQDEEYALCQIDIDSFKVINDVYGHSSGDALMCAISKVIQDCVRQEDIIGRLGNDEFGIIISHCNQRNATALANNIRNAISKLRMTVDKTVYGVTVSIGIQMINRDNTDAAENIRKVEIACHAAKQSGDKVQMYYDNHHLIASYHQDLHWVDRINNALEHDQFELYAQEILPLTASEIINKPVVCEILLRMQSQDGEIIAPGKFLPVAARHNMASRIDYFVINQVIDYLQSHLELCKKCSMIMINLSGQSLGDEKILNHLFTLLKDVQFPTEVLCFEITESETIRNLSAAIHFIRVIQNHFGCRFALDDFGAGFSSFKYIKELPVDIIKIDGSFVRDIHNDRVSEIMMQSLNDIAQVTNKKTIAEWVECKEVLDTLQDMGVDYCQGYFIGKPAPLDGFMSRFT